MRIKQQKQGGRGTQMRNTTARAQIFTIKRCISIQKLKSHVKKSNMFSSTLVANQCVFLIRLRCNIQVGRGGCEIYRLSPIRRVEFDNFWDVNRCHKSTVNDILQLLFKIHLRCTGTIVESSVGSRRMVICRSPKQQPHRIPRVPLALSQRAHEC